MKFLITALDVSLFLVEALVKAAGPLVTDGGTLAASRAAQTFSGSLLLTPLHSLDRHAGQRMGSGRWKMYDQFKKPLEIRDDVVL